MLAGLRRRNLLGSKERRHLQTCVGHEVLSKRAKYGEELWDLSKGRERIEGIKRKLQDCCDVERVADYDGLTIFVQM